VTEHTNNIKITQPKKVNSTTYIHQKKPRLTDGTDRAWFGRLVRHPARKQSESILTTRSLHGVTVVAGGRLH